MRLCPCEVVMEYRQIASVDVPKFCPILFNIVDIYNAERKSGPDGGPPA
jgi:hypothetical protein